MRDNIFEPGFGISWYRSLRRTLIPLVLCATFYNKEGKRKRETTFF